MLIIILQCDIKHTYQIGYWVIFSECIGLLPHTIVPNNYLCLSIEYISHHITQGYLALTVCVFVRQEVNIVISVRAVHA